MKTYFISYDLTCPEDSADYRRIIDCIKEFGYRAKPLKSLWLIRTEVGANDIRTQLEKVIDDNDRLLIMEVSSEWASRNLPKEVLDWMHRNV